MVLLQVNMLAIQAKAAPSSSSCTRLGASGAGWSLQLPPPACGSLWLVVLPELCRRPESSRG